MTTSAPSSWPWPRRIAVGLGLAVLLVAAWLLLGSSTYFPSSSLPSGRMTSWQLNRTILGPVFDPRSAMTTTVVHVEVSRPECAPPDSSWFEPIVTYTPVSVTIALRMTDAAAATCGSVDPRVGDYLMGVYFPVRLSEPLAGRALFDGSMFPPQARPYPEGLGASRNARHRGVDQGGAVQGVAHSLHRERHPGCDTLSA